MSKRSVLVQPMSVSTPVIYRPHARDKMLERNITEEHVETLLQSGYDLRAIYPPRTSIGTSVDKFIFWREFEGRVDNGLAVVVTFPKDEAFKWEIITVMNDFQADGWKDWEPSAWGEV